MVESTKMTIFGEPINHNQAYGLPSRFREPFDEIHRNICPNPCRDGKGFEQCGKECHFTLVALEGIKFSFHSLPKEVTSYPLICFEEPRVPYRWRSMEFIEDILLKICALGKHYKTLISHRITIPRVTWYNIWVTDQLLDDFR